MTSSHSADAAGPSRRGYVAAAVLVVVGIVAAALFGWRFVQALPSIDRMSSTTLTVRDGEQLALWLEGGGGIGITCQLSGETGTQTLSSGNASFTVNRWERIAITPESLPAGSYELSCTGLGETLRPEQIGVSDNPTVSSFALPIVLAFLVGGGSIVLAGIVALVTFLRRRKQESAQRGWYGSPGYGPGYGQPPAYGQPPGQDQPPAYGPAQRPPPPPG